MNPVSGERFEFLPREPGMAGCQLRMNVSAPAGVVSPPRHIHRRERERFEVLDGEVTLLVGRDRLVLRLGDAADVPPGQAHTGHNSGGRPLNMIVEFTPAGAMRSFFETFCGLAREHACDERGQPPVLQVAASLPLWQMYLAGAPIAVRQVMMVVLRPLALARGYRSRYPRFEAQMPEAQASDA